MIFVSMYFILSSAWPWIVFHQSHVCYSVPMWDSFLYNFIRKLLIYVMPIINETCWRYINDFVIMMLGEDFGFVFCGFLSFFLEAICFCDFDGWSFFFFFFGFVGWFFLFAWTDCSYGHLIFSIAYGDVLLFGLVVGIWCWVAWAFVFCFVCKWFLWDSDLLFDMGMIFIFIF